MDGEDERQQFRAPIALAGLPHATHGLVFRCSAVVRLAGNAKPKRINHPHHSVRWLWLKAVAALARRFTKAVLETDL